MIAIAWDKFQCDVFVKQALWSYVEAFGPHGWTRAKTHDIMQIKVVVGAGWGCGQSIATNYEICVFPKKSVLCVLVSHILWLEGYVFLLSSSVWRNI